MKKLLHASLILALTSSAIFTMASANADDDKDGKRYVVTITNLTRGQVLTPPAVIAHNRHFSLFSFGSQASPELATLAESGNPADLIAAAGSSSAVHQAVSGSGVILPGTSLSIEIEADNGFSEISIAAMLASTNDAFMAVRGIRLPERGTVIVEADAYDAGSEANSESCAFIPGPPCGNNAHDPATAEGFVHVHSGIHGGAGLNPATHDWRNPVAQIEISRLN